MNALEQFIRSNQLNEHDTLMKLRDWGAISDNAISASDVATVDCERSVLFLETP